jgi:Dolichyl-phosphate-mannose-protein mannosyltransferase
VPAATDTLHAPVEEVAEKRRLGNRAYAFWLTFIGIAALAVRVIYVAARWHNYVGVSFDQYWYQNLATLITKGKGISNPTVYARTGTLEATALHGPLTSFLLVPFDYVGYDTLGEHQLLIALAGAVTVVILGVLAGRMVNRAAGLVTAFVGALYPGLWAFDAKVMSEPVEQLLVALVLLFAYGFRYRPTTTRAVCLGVSVGLAVLTRSELVLLVPLLVVPVCIGAFRHKRGSGLGLKTAIAIGSTALVLAPWIAYCQTAFHDPEVLSSDLGIGLIQDNNGHTYFGPRIGFWYSPASGHPIAGDESQIDHNYQHLALSYAKAHYTQLPQVVLARIGRLWDLYEPFQTAQFTAVPASCPPVTGCEVDSVEDLATQQAWIWSFYVLSPLAVIGLVVLRRRRTIIYPILSLAVVVTLVAVIEAGVLRFRAPFEDAFVVLVGIGIHALFKWAFNRGGGRHTKRAATSVA